MLIDADGRCKVADLGLARTHSEFDVESVASLDQRRKEAADLTWADVGGTAQYMAPRVIAEYLKAVKDSGKPVLPEIPEGATGEAAAASNRRRRTRGRWISVSPVAAVQMRTNTFLAANLAKLEALEAHGFGGSGGGDDGRQAQGKQDINEPSATCHRPLRIWHAPDVYAFGIILWEVLTLERPWGEMSYRDIWAHVQRGDRLPVTAADEAGAPEGYAALMRELWAHDPVARPMFSEALKRLRKMARPDLDLVSDLFDGQLSSQLMAAPSSVSAAAEARSATIVDVELFHSPSGTRVTN